ncbi:MAG: AIM24 family protein, partial [Acidimicrobiales bacterium]
DRAGPVVTDVSARIQCKWCRGQSPATATTCERCGAPLDIRDAVTDSGWRQAPAIRDLTEIHFWNSVAQVDGTVVPVVDVELGAGDWVFFEHHVMLWKDENVAMSVMDTPGGAKRILAGMPFVLSVAQGPGRVSFSRDAPGEIVMLPVDPGTELDAREHAMLLASAGLTFSFEKIQGMKSMLALGSGMYLDRYVARDAPGLLVLHGYGNVMQRELAAGESIQVEPGGFLYKDASVTMEISTQKLSGEDADGEPSAASQGMQAAKGLASKGFAGLRAARSAMKSGDKIGGLVSGLQAAVGASTNTSMTLMRLVGPGRVGIQSMYMAHETG